MKSLNIPVAVVAISGSILAYSAEAALNESCLIKEDKTLACSFPCSTNVIAPFLFIDISNVYTIPSQSESFEIASTSLRSFFISLRDKWFNDPVLKFSSSAQSFMKAEPFLELIKLGKGIYPFILEDLDRETAIRWDLVLTHINASSIIPEGEWGNPDRIVRRWGSFLKQLASTHPDA